LLGTPYGDGKKASADLLSRVAAKHGGEFNNFLLPNVFGEHGKPDYNMVTSTFCDAVVTGRSLRILVDQELTLMHAQDVADLLLGISSEEDVHKKTSSLTVKELSELIQDLWALYEDRSIPEFQDNLSLQLWNTLISHIPPERRLHPLRGVSDARGTFREVLRVPGSSLQVSVSDTQPGLTRGNHFHRRKFERFIVLDGSALIRLWQDEKGWVNEYRVTGENPQWIDMPTCWMHSISNVGSVPLTTLFISDAPFDSHNPDTFYEEPT
jgi:UDP-2-acetamido-2,6-beta-L-arabino-hexul-4-ose reductase